MLCSIRYGSTLIVEGSISFVELMTAMLALMMGALGLGQALNDLGDVAELRDFKILM